MIVRTFRGARIVFRDRARMESAGASLYDTRFAPLLGGDRGVTTEMQILSCWCYQQLQSNNTDCHTSGR